MAERHEGLVARVEVLIRRPVSEVFKFFVKPDHITRFWLAKASGPLVTGQRVHWEYMVPGAAEDVDVEAVELDRRIQLSWSAGRRLELGFSEHAKHGTRLVITDSGFRGEDAVQEALESTQGFTIVACELKALLERELTMNFVRDKALLLRSA